jgi:hypothetical protein
MHNAALHARIGRDQSWHQPQHPVIGAALDRIREIGLTAAHQWADLMPDNDHARTAAALIDEAQMYAVKAIIVDQQDVIDRLAPMPVDTDT